MVSPRPRRPASACCLHLLQRRSLSAAELQQRLEARDYDAAEVACALRDMQRLRYVDDDALAENLARSAQTSGRGPRWAARKLKQRLLPTAAAEAALAAAFADPAQSCATATDLLRRRFYRDGPPQTKLLRARLQQRALRFLLGRGFTGRDAYAALQRAAAAEPGDDADEEILPC